MRLQTILGLILAVRALANDTFVTLGAGGLIPARTAAISIESEDLEISARRITVQYLFRNRTQRDIDATVVPGLSRAAPTRYQLTRTNFHPDRELDLNLLTARQRE